jgi:hypothetical protein
MGMIATKISERLRRSWRGQIKICLMKAVCEKVDKNYSKYVHFVDYDGM